MAALRHTPEQFLHEMRIAAANSFVTVDVPVDSNQEWSGLTIKKADNSNLPSPWFDTISIVLP